MITELFNDKEKSEEKYTTTYRCKPDEASIMVMAFPFAKPNSKETEINTNSINFKEIYDLDNLEDIELKTISTDRSNIQTHLVNQRKKLAINERNIPINEIKYRSTKKKIDQ